MNQQPGAPGGGGAPFAPAFGGFINDQTAAMGFQVGRNMAAAGQEYLEQNVSMPGLSCRESANSMDVDEKLRLNGCLEALL